VIKRRKLGKEPAPFKGSSLEMLTFASWCPIPYGWILWFLGFNWAFDMKSKWQEYGVCCFITIAVGFVAWCFLHTDEKKHEALIEAKK
jgi:hypothetical protein